MNRQSAFAVACAVSATTALGVVASPAGAIDLKQLIDTNDMIVSGDKKFSDFFFSATCDALSECSPIEANDIEVNPIVDGMGNFGINFNGVFRAISGVINDVELRYTVEVTDPNYWISAVHLDADFNENDGIVNITETLNDMSGNRLGQIEVDNDPTSPVGLPPAWVDLTTPAKKLLVKKDIGFVGFNEKGESQPVFFSIVDQTFSQKRETVPEPGAVTGLLAIGSLSVGAMLKRHFGKKA
ncbi:hypothetical protein [Coleofasciculus chthonoplastes]|uniref:hypothetical protein n=1 Tax=Coleofasciculus chthonoplastes TaxID=64178 RepID=UPI0033037D78